MAGFRDFLVRLALAASVALPIYFVIAALGTKHNLWDWRFGFGQLTFTMGPKVILGVAVLALVALFFALLVPPRRGRRLAAAALLIPAVALGYGAMSAQRAAAIPPIHDISTDLGDIPTFTDTTVKTRALVTGVNSLDLAAKTTPTTPSKRFGAWEGRKVTDIQKEAYGDIAPIQLTMPATDAYAKAEATAVKLGWEMSRSDAAKLTFEATVQSFWFGFIDDIVVRVRPTAEGAVVDVRSVSRVGLSDLGANAARVRAFAKEIQGSPKS
jgi:uncharacterized protein (DUF1499 family)